MGKRILRLFEEAYGLGGLVARMRLASTAQLSSMEAETIEDSPEVVQRVQAALDEIKRQLPHGGREEKAAPSAVHTRAGDDQSHVLRRHVAAYLDLMSQRSLYLGDVDATIRRVNETASLTLDVQRVSVWYNDSEHTKLACVDLFQRDRAEHSAGTELLARDHAPYFRALEAERTIAAHDARADPRTSCLSESYLKPPGITSLLDVPILIGRKMVGVLCHEHVGPKRLWTRDEEAFADLLSNFVALALERHGPDVAPRTIRMGPPVTGSGLT